jgi:hypothetical protein
MTIPKQHYHCIGIQWILFCVLIGATLCQLTHFNSNDHQHREMEHVLCCSSQTSTQNDKQIHIPIQIGTMLDKNFVNDFILKRNERTCIKEHYAGDNIIINMLPYNFATVLFNVLSSYNQSMDIYCHSSSLFVQYNESVLEKMELALEKGAKFGRNTYGIIYIWSNADYRMNSIYALHIGNQKISSPNTIVSVPGHINESMLTVSLLIANLLKINNELTYRDIKYILIESAMVNNENRKWDSYNGFGYIDEIYAIKLAQAWIPVPALEYLNYTTIIDHILNSHEEKKFEFRVNDDLYVEHVKLRLDTNTYSNSTITIKSPSNTAISSLSAFNSLITIQFWGEKSSGIWKVTISSQSNINIHQITLELFGTKEEHLIIIPEPTPTPQGTIEKAKPWWKIGKFSLNSIIVVSTFSIISLTIGIIILVMVIKIQMAEETGSNEVEDEIWSEMVHNAYDKGSLTEESEVTEAEDE